jgi:hypothetical protein
MKKLFFLMPLALSLPICLPPKIALPKQPLNKRLRTRPQKTPSKLNRFVNSAIKNLKTRTGRRSQTLQSIKLHGQLIDRLCVTCLPR